MIPLPAVLRAIGGTRNRVNKWKAAGYLSHDVPESSPGIPSEVTREAALEIALMTALTRTGHRPASAHSLVTIWLLTRRGEIKGREMAGIFVTDPISEGTTFPSRNTTLGEISERLATLVKMPTGPIRRKSFVQIVVCVEDIIKLIDVLADHYEGG